MGGRGPAPKPREKRQRTNAEPVEPIQFDGRPVPPPKLTGLGRLQPETKRWWKTWTTCPQAAVFTATDWEQLLLVVPLIDAYWREPKVTTLGEIRLQMAKFGATPEDRLRLRWTIKPPEEAPKTDSGKKRAQVIELVKDTG